MLDELTQSKPAPTELLDLDLIRQRARDSFYFFAKGILKHDWLVPHIHGSVCKLLTNRAEKRKKIVLPRGWLKTTLCTISYPIWRAVHDPNLRILIAQNNLENARKKLGVIKSQFETNGLLRALYPELLPGVHSRWSAESLCLTRSTSHAESTFECIGVRGQGISRHYNIIVEDDTVAPDFDELGQEMLAPSHDDVRKAITWHSLALPMLTDALEDEIIVVGTRWYENDLMSHIDEKEPQYASIERSCREDAEGKSDPRGFVTYPERFSEEVLIQYEQSLGPYFYSTLMLNRPIAVGDMVFRAEWFKEYEELPLRQFLDIYTTVDCATDPQLSMGRVDDLDYSTVLTTGKHRLTGDIYILDYFRERCNPGDHAAAIFEHVIRWHPIVVGYESVAYQRSMDYWLKELMRQRQIYFLLEPVERTGRNTKDFYIMGLHPMAAAGIFHIRSYMRDLLTEFLSYPRGLHDDLIDTLSMQLRLWKRTRDPQPHNREDDPNNPLSVAAAIMELKARNRGYERANSVVFAPLKHGTTLHRPVSSQYVDN